MSEFLIEEVLEPAGKRLSPPAAGSPSTVLMLANMLAILMSKMMVFC